MDLLKDNIRKIYFRYLIPCLGSAIVMSIYTMTDAIVIGQGVGANALSGLNLITPLLCIIFAGAIFIGVGCSVHYGIQMGMSNSKKAREYFTVALMIIFTLAIILTVSYSSWIKELLILLGAGDSSPDIMEYGLRYMKYYVFFIPFAAISSFLSIMVRADNNPSRAMAGVIAGGVVNIVLDIVFVYPCKMGMGGAALASGLGVSLQLIIITTHFLSERNNLKPVRITHFLRKAANVICGGFSSFLNEFANGVIVFIFNKQLIKYCGLDELAIYGVMVSYVILFNALFTGVGQTMQPIISYNYGAKSFDRIDKIKKYGYTTAILMSVVFALSGIVFPAAMCKVFVKLTPEIVELSAVTLRIYFIAFLFMGFNVVSSYYLQAILKERQSFIISMSRNLVLSGIMLVVVPIFFGGKSMWYIMPIVEIVTFFMAWFMLKYKKESKNNYEEG